MDSVAVGGSSTAGKTEAERWLGVAARLLAARDLVGSKRFAERALEFDPLLDGVDQILAVADVLLASELRVNNHLDWYSILQLPHPSSSGDPSPSAVNRHYRRFVLLLHPDRNKFPGADSAFRIVVDAFAVLSDPSKKSLFDAELHIADRSNPDPDPDPDSYPDPDPNLPSFWTACPFCCHVYQHLRTYRNRSLRCQSCLRPFLAAEISGPPPVVPGTDMYYSSWGFFPLGFPGGPTAANVPDLGSGWKSFYPMFPWPDPREGLMRNGADENVVEREVPSRNKKKKIARKKIGGSLKKRAFVVEIDTKAKLGSDINVEKERRGININEEAVGGPEGVEGVREEEMTGFHLNLDVDATEDVLGNLQNLPFF